MDDQDSPGVSADLLSIENFQLLLTRIKELEEENYRLRLATALIDRRSATKRGRPRKYSPDLILGFRHALDDAIEHGDFRSRREAIRWLQERFRQRGKHFGGARSDEARERKLRSLEKLVSMAGRKQAFSQK